MRFKTKCKRGNDKKEDNYKLLELNHKIWVVLGTQNEF